MYVLLLAAAAAAAISTGEILYVSYGIIYRLVNLNKDRRLVVT